MYPRRYGVSLVAVLIKGVTTQNKTIRIFMSPFNPLAPNDIHIYTSYRTANLQTLHFKYLLNKYTY